MGGMDRVAHEDDVAVVPMAVAVGERRAECEDPTYMLDERSRSSHAQEATSCAVGREGC